MFLFLLGDGKKYDTIGFLKNCKQNIHPGTVRTDGERLRLVLGDTYHDKKSLIFFDRTDEMVCLGTMMHPKTCAIMISLAYERFSPLYAVYERYRFPSVVADILVHCDEYPKISPTMPKKLTDLTHVSYTVQHGWQWEGGKQGQQCIVFPHFWDLYQSLGHRATKKHVAILSGSSTKSQRQTVMHGILQKKIHVLLTTGGGMMQDWQYLTDVCVYRSRDSGYTRQRLPQCHCPTVMDRVAEQYGAVYREIG